MRRYDTLVMTHKKSKGECPEKMNNRFKLRSQNSNYDLTRNSDVLQAVRPRLELTKRASAIVL